jgi:hypothetical protein
MEMTDQTPGVEFKYDRHPDMLVKQMSGELRGLKALNRSNLVAQLEDHTLSLHVKHLDQNFFIAGLSGVMPRTDTSRERAYELLKETFSQGRVWGRLIDENQIVRKFIIEEDAEVTRTDNDRELYVNISVVFPEELEDAEDAF